MGVTVWLACLVCAIAVVYDVRFRRIPNFITLPLIVIVPAMALTQGFPAFERSLLLLVCLFVGAIIAHTTGWIGGGDLKLLIGIGAALGYPRVIAFLLFTAVAGGIVALIIAMSRRRLHMLGAQLRTALLSMVSGAGVSNVAPLETATFDERVPYVLAIALGLVTELVLAALDPARFGS